MKRKREITFEVEETTIVRAAAQTAAFCPRCRLFVEMLRPETAAALVKLTEREIFVLIESGRLHFLEAERVFVCRNCLTNVSETFAPANEVQTDNTEIKKDSCVKQFGID
jgi:hypothetical protein